MDRKLLFGFAFLLVVFAAGFSSAQDFDADFNSDQAFVEVDSNPEINLTVAQWYPKGGDYVFICESSGFEPTSYNWWFGDGEKLINVSNRDVFHRYEEVGTYTVMCSATDGNISAEGLLTIAVEDNVNNITILEEYSAEHNQIFRCNTRIENVTHYIWYVDGEQVFEKTSLPWYGPGSETFPNYFHTFPGNGSYEISCFAENDLGENTKIFRTVDISTRATPEEIEGNIAVPRVSVEYLGDYIVKHTCEVIGVVSPVAQFATFGSHNISDSYMRFSVNGYGTYIQPSVSELNETLPGFGNHTLLCTGGTKNQDEYSEWHNKGMRASQSCLGGPRDGYPKCNVGKASEDFSVEKESHVLSGIYVEQLGNNSYETRCYPRREGGPIIMNVPTLGKVWVDGGHPLVFNTSETEFTIECDAINHILSRGSRKEAFFSQKFNFSPANASIKIHEIFPADQVYVFECETDIEETNSTVWTWDFGDGTGSVREGFRTYSSGNPYGSDVMPNKDVYHVFPRGGEFEVTCTASDGERNVTANRMVDVDYQAATEIFANKIDHYSSYDLYCDPLGFEASGTVWKIGKSTGQEIYFNGPYGGISRFNFTFLEEGNYTIECKATSGDDRFRSDYWGGDSAGYIPCNSPFGCVSSRGNPVNLEIINLTSPSELFLISGDLNGQEVSSKNRTIIVAPGEEIRGELNTIYSLNEWSGGFPIYFASTTNWGDPSSQCDSHGNFWSSVPSNGSRDFSINYIAPEVPGEYYIIVAFRRHFSALQLCSMVGGRYMHPIWSDGNDIADWDTEMIKYTNENGNVLGRMQYGEDYYNAWVPATTIRIVVE